MWSSPAAPSLLTPNGQDLVNPGKDGKVTSESLQQVKGAWDVSDLERSTGLGIRGDNTNRFQPEL